MKNLSNYLAKCIPAMSLALLCLASSTANAVTTLTFDDNVNPVDPFPSLGTWPLLGLTYTTVFSVTPLATGEVNSEYRMIQPANSVGGGGHKNLTDPGATQQWIFGDDVNLTAVAGTDTTGGSLTAGSAAPNGDVGVHLNAPFFDVPFGFLAPTVGSPAGNLYGNGTISVDIAGGTLQVVFPVLEAQWGGTHFPLGLVDDTIRGNKITFNGTVSNIQPGVPGPGQTTFDFVLTAEHVITGPLEDPGSAGFTNWTAQWNLAGTGVAPVVTLNPPSSTDTIAATVAGTAADDGRITQAELEDPALYNAPVDDGVTSSCVGSCFAFTVTGVAGSTQVVLPLSAPIPSGAVYRKLIAGAWTNFDDQNGDTIESGQGAQGNCAGVVYTPGLTEGDFCVRLTIADDGTNDDAYATVGTVVDPGGVGVPIVVAGGGGRAPQSIDDAPGCSISTSANDKGLLESAEWLLLAGFISLLAIRRKMIN